MSILESISFIKLYFVHSFCEPTEWHLPTCFKNSLHMNAYKMSHIFCHLFNKCMTGGSKTQVPWGAAKRQLEGEELNF